MFLKFCILQVDLSTKKKKIPSCDLYYDMKYTVPYLTFSNLVNGTNFIFRYDGCFV